MSKTSPTQLTLKRLRSAGWSCAIGEKWNAFAKIRQDLYGFGDILCCKRGCPKLLVQCTSLSNVSSRKLKILANEVADIWTDGGRDRVEVWGWVKKKSRWDVKRFLLGVDRCFSEI